MCSGWTERGETGRHGEPGQEGGEQRVNGQALMCFFPESVYEAVFSKKQKGEMPARAVQRDIFLPRCVGLELPASHHS